jgi:DNA-binding beta-propeller fold protein YncE
VLPTPAANPIDPPPSAIPLGARLRLWLTWERLLFGLILLAGVFTRFYDLETRVMSHDETQHTYFSWLLYQGRGYQHTPLTHGPLQFHLMALSYGVIGDNDFGARVPHAAASALALLFLWWYRRYLGRAGALVAAALMVISPYMLYYGRYARNEPFVVLFGVITLWAILRYLESGQVRYIYYLTLATVLHFTAKETAYIYTAQAMLFLGLFLLNRLTRRPWPNPAYLRPFLLAAMLAFVILGLALLAPLMNESAGSEAAPPAFFTTLPVSLSLAIGLLAVYFLLRGLGLAEIRKERAFDLLILLGTLVLPHLAPFPVKALGGNPLDYSSQGILRTGAILAPLAILAVLIGFWWNRRLWLLNALLFYGIYALLYTTLFTNGQGFFTGLVGSLGYWLEQQGVQRGSQPWYFYLLVQVPIYEYLPLLGSLLALFVVRWRLRPAAPPDPGPEADDASPGAPPLEERLSPAPLLAFWSITSLLAYTIAGEKMPWLTVHITLPMILLAGWALGQWIERIDWRSFIQNRGLWVLALILAFTESVSALGNIWREISAAAVFDWNMLPGLLATLVFAIGSGFSLLMLLRLWTPGQFIRLAVLGGFAWLGVLTARTAIQAAYINYDLATEFLVYAHAAPSNKQLANQVAGLSGRLYGDLSIGVAYDNSDGQGDPASAWPLTWYLRDFTNTRAFGPEGGRELLDYPVIFVSDRNWDRLDPLLRNTYYSFEVNRMWWPMQDYFGLDRARITAALGSPEMRRALYDIWIDRDFTRYAAQTGQDLSINKWQPSRRMRFYIRRDMAAQLWNYGSTPLVIEPEVDRYAQGKISLAAARIIDQAPEGGPLLQRPRDVALAPDGSLYVADTGNHRILHLSPQGDLLQAWGSFADGSQSPPAPPGTFNEPWGVAVASDGSVYVADTWNHRVQKFTAQGQHVRSWGYFGQAEAPEAFWGPRSLAVDGRGRVYVTDTGNKRVVVFDQDGVYQTQIDAGFNEPVGIAIDAQGVIYVADTWNQRIAAFQEVAERIFAPQTSWQIDGWYGQSLENKPRLAVSPDGRLFASDPEGYRILEFTTDGAFMRTWGEFGSTAEFFTLPGGVAADAQGGVWVVDSGSNRLMYYQPPPASPAP